MPILQRVLDADSVLQEVSVLSGGDRNSMSSMSSGRNSMWSPVRNSRASVSPSRNSRSSVSSGRNSRSSVSSGRNSRASYARSESPVFGTMHDTVSTLRKPAPERVTNKPMSIALQIKKVREELDAVNTILTVPGHIHRDPSVYNTRVAELKHKQNTLFAKKMHLESMLPSVSQTFSEYI